MQFLLVGESSSTIIADKEKRQIKGRFGSNFPILRFDWWEGEEFELVFSDNANDWNLNRVAQRGCHLLDNHMHKSLGLVETVSISSQFDFVATIARTTEGDDYLKRVEDGIAGGFSFGCWVGNQEEISPAEYSYDEKGRRTELVKMARYRAVDIELFEISVAFIPANPDTGIYMGMDKNSLKSIEDMKREKIHLNMSNQKDSEFANSENKRLQTEITALKTEFEAINQDLQKVSASRDQLTEQLNVVKEQSKITQKYYELRALAEVLKQDGKLPVHTFNRLLGENPAEKLADVKANSQLLGNIEFFLEECKTNTPQLNTELSTPKPEIPTNPQQEEKLNSEQIEIEANRVVSKVFSGKFTI